MPDSSRLSAQDTSFKLGIASRLTVLFTCLAILMLAGVGLLAYFSDRAARRQQALLDLQDKAAEKEAAIIGWLGQKRLITANLASAPQMQQFLPELTGSASDASPAPAGSEPLRALLQQWADPESAFLGFLVLHPETGQVLLATDPGEEGAFKATMPYFLEGRVALYVQSPYRAAEFEDNIMTIASPIWAADGRLLGVLAGHLDLDQLAAIVQRSGRSFRTENSLLINSLFLPISSPVFTELEDEELTIRSAAVQRCLASKDTGALLYEDHRGVPVLGAYRWLADMDWCLIVKFEQSEALAPGSVVRIVLAGVTALIVLMALVIAPAMTRIIVRPLQQLQDGVTRFGRGELDARLPESATDEFGALAGQFNRMADALVEEQTYLRRRSAQFFNLSLDMLCTASFDGYLIDLNPAWEKTLGYTFEELRARPFIEFIHLDDREATLADTAHLFGGGQAIQFENRCRDKSGDYHWLSWSAVASEEDQLLFAVARDVTAKKLDDEQLLKRSDELARSNKELEQFAYVASHDLQEPLRMVSSYLQLLERRFGNQLDGDAHEFIAFAIDGANRMKSLITDLLAFSRVGTRGKEPAAVSMPEILSAALDNLHLAIEETQAEVICESPLPTVMADDGQMVQLLQNLIGNALKFRSQLPPIVRVSARFEGEHWLFAVRDNGIGIDLQYAERIFVLFQRLHNRQEYPGTGIGLALCRKIIERHGGRIWVDSRLGHGATFYFTLPPVVAEEDSVLPEETVSTEQPVDGVVQRARDLV